MAGEGDAERLVFLLEARIKDFERNMAKAGGTGKRTYDQLRAGSSRATQQMEADMQRSTSRINDLLASTSTKIGSFGKGLVGGLVGGLAIGGVGELVRTLGDVAKGIATIGDEARRAGLSTKAFQELKFVAEQNRVGVDSLVDGIKELNLRADEFIQTGAGPAAEAFNRLGYDAATLKTKLKDPSALFTEIIGKLEKLDKAAQIRIADEVFGGTGGEKFVQLIEQGEAGIRDQIKAANDLGIIMDDQLIKKADELDRKFNQVATTVGTALKTAVVEAASALQAFINEFSKFNADYEARKAAADLGSLAGSLAGTSSVDPALDAERKRLREALKLNQQAIDADAANGLDAGADDLAERQALQEQLRLVEEQIKAQRRLNVEKSQTQQFDQRSMTTRGGPARYSPGTLDLPGTVDVTPDRRVDPYFADATGGGSSSADKLKREAEKAADKLNDAIARQTATAVDAAATLIGMNENTDAGTINAFLRRGGVDLNAATTAWCAGFVNSALAQVGVTGSGSNVATDFMNWGVSVDLANIQRGDVLVDSNGKGAGQTGGHVGFATGQLRVTADGIKQLEMLSGNAADQVTTDWVNASEVIGRRASEAFQLPADALRHLTDESKAAKEAAEEQAEAWEEFGEIGIDAARGLAAALADGKLEGEELLAIVADIIQQLLSMPEVQKGLGNLFSGLFGGGGGLFGGAGGGDPWAGLRVPTYATGTSNHPGGLARVNEYGRGEIMDLPNGTRVIPHDISKQMARGGGVVVNHKTIIENRAGAEVSEETTQDETGGYRTNVIIEKRVAAAINRPGSAARNAVIGMGGRSPMIKR